MARKARVEFEGAYTTSWIAATGARRFLAMTHTGSGSFSRRARCAGGRVHAFVLMSSRLPRCTRKMSEVHRLLVGRQASKAPQARQMEFSHTGAERQPQPPCAMGEGGCERRDGGEHTELRLRVVAKPEKETAQLLAHLGLQIPCRSKIIEMQCRKSPEKSPPPLDDGSCSSSKKRT
jgi:hypothetical protein